MDLIIVAVGPLIEGVPEVTASLLFSRVEKSLLGRCLVMREAALAGNGLTRGAALVLGSWPLVVHEEAFHRRQVAV